MKCYRHKISSVYIHDVYGHKPTWFYMIDKVHAFENNIFIIVK